jgi:hypothetical protein
VPNVLIRDLPPEVHAVLVRRAEAAGQSLQQYLVAELTRMASSPTMGELIERVELRLQSESRQHDRSSGAPRRRPPGRQDIVKDIRRMRGDA